MKPKTIYRLLRLAASTAVLVLAWAGKIAVELLALGAAADRRPPRDARERRYTHDHEGYSWEGRPDETK